MKARLFPAALVVAAGFAAAPVVWLRTNRRRRQPSLGWGARVAARWR
jgi:hypothetical protein